MTDAGEELLHPGDAAGFKAGTPDGHCLQNRSSPDALVLEVGTRGAGYAHRDGTPYPSAVRRGGRR